MKSNITELKIEYRTLSRVQEEFGRNPSKHKVALYVNKRMGEIIREIEESKNIPKPISRESVKKAMIKTYGSFWNKNSTIIEEEIVVDDVLLEGLKFDKINSLDLRSDFENHQERGLRGTILRTQGYVGNAQHIDGEHEDDTWAIDCLGENGQVFESYLYASQFEYDEDVKLLREFK